MFFCVGKNRPHLSEGNSSTWTVLEDSGIKTRGATRSFQLWERSPPPLEYVICLRGNKWKRRGARWLFSKWAMRLRDTLVCGAPAIILCIIDISTSQYNLYISDKQIGNSEAARDAVSACCYYDNGIILICLCVPKRHGTMLSPGLWLDKFASARHSQTNKYVFAKRAMLRCDNWTGRYSAHIPCFVSPVGCAEMPTFVPVPSQTLEIYRAAFSIYFYFANR